ncbi:MAG TPA: secondary thiamine-phosphate synthase enzyme YjbQ, partial [Thermoanaerobaculia bacterium]|jgi:secondary thiamine-phosphate synthase enzyme|nr:secondary thiamine-phosphate synthase enzyme YjbQ [Thermoanaerobaculia bacterium]
MLREQSFTVRTTAREQILLITSDVQRALSSLTLNDGIATIIVPHTTCAISVNENADPDVPADLTKALRALVPKVRFAHGEGNSDAHFLSTLIGTSLSWPYRNGQLILGTWQGIYFIELDGPRPSRKVTVYVNG